MKLKFKHLAANLSFIFILSNAIGQDTLATQQFEMNNCVQLYFNGKTRVVPSRTVLDSMIRKDGSEQRCLEMLKDLDLEHYSLLGVNLNSGWCRAPMNLSFVITRMDLEKKYVFEISYYLPIEPCRAMSSYDLWVTVPALPDGYEVEFVIEPRMRKELSEYYLDY